MQSAAAKRRLTQDWASIRRYHGWITANSMASGGFLSSKFLDFCHSLVLVHAYSVLQATLEQYKRERTFSAKGRELQRLTQASRPGLNWIDYDAVDRGRDKRNDVAHKGQYPPRSDSWSYMKAIEAELVGWGVVPPQPPW